MLTEKEKEEILEEAARYPHKKAAAVDALKIVQQYRGWISDDAVSDIAGFLEMSAEEVDGIATFYSRIYRKPVGRNVILICDSISCMVMGYQTLYEYISGKLGIRFGETTADGRFTLLPAVCLGVCDQAPAMMINEELFTLVTVEKIDGLLENYK